MLTTTNTPRWDIFCTVVDNFGDIGVCWRLAQQLAEEHGLTVRLWVDDLLTFQQLCPAITLQQQQSQQQVEIRHWQVSTDFTHIEVADVVIEAFACTIPPPYLAAMTASAIPPVWFNLEYLTAETWAGEYHGLPSVEPHSGLCKYFFFPGFETNTGGLLRETSLLAQRDALQRNPVARSAFLAGLGITPAADALLISLFAYENSALPALLDAMAAGDQALHIVIPQGRVTASIEAYLGEALTLGQPVVRGSVCLQSIAFMTPADYDQLLWCCDLNGVRGEDSLVRAMWAGRPLLWHCYPQADKAHQVKVQALLTLYCQSMTPLLSQATTALWLVWNQGAAHIEGPNKDLANGINTGPLSHEEKISYNSAGELWNEYIARISALSSHAMAWSSALSKQPDLATQMLQFYQKLL